MTYDELSESIKKAREEREVESYNLKQENKSLDKMLDSYEEYKRKEKLGIVTDEDKESFKELEQEILDFNESLPDDSKILTFKPDGAVNWKESEKSMTKQKGLNKEKIAENTTKNYKDAMKLVKKDLNKFMKDDNALQSVLDYSIFSIDPDRNWTDKERKALERLFEEGVEKMGKDFDPSKINAKSFLSKIDLFEEALDQDGNLFSERVELYQKALETMTIEEAEAFKRSYPEYAGVLNSLGGDYERVSSILNELNLEPEQFNSLTMAAEGAGLSLAGLLDSYQNFYDDLPDGMSEAEKQAVALQKLRDSYDGLGVGADDLKLVLKTIASGGSIQNVTQKMDSLNTVIDNLNDAQQKFIEGKLTDAELFELFESHAELFSDPNFIDNFINGKGLMSVVGLQERREQQEKYRKELARLKQEIKSLSGEERKAMQGEINRLELLISYRGELANMTKEQIRYNDTLMAYNNLLDLGFDSITMQQKVVEMSERNIASVIDKTSIAMKTINNDLELAGLK